MARLAVLAFGASLALIVASVAASAIVDTFGRVSQSLETISARSN